MRRATRTHATLLLGVTCVALVAGAAALAAERLGRRRALASLCAKAWTDVRAREALLDREEPEAFLSLLELYRARRARLIGGVLPCLTYTWCTGPICVPVVESAEVLAAGDFGEDGTARAALERWRVDPRADDADRLLALYLREELSAPRFGRGLRSRLGDTPVDLPHYRRVPELPCGAISLRVLSLGEALAPFPRSLSHGEHPWLRVYERGFRRPLPAWLAAVRFAQEAEVALVPDASGAPRFETNRERPTLLELAHAGGDHLERTVAVLASRDPPRTRRALVVLRLTEALARLDRTRRA